MDENKNIIDEYKEELEELRLEEKKAKKSNNVVATVVAELASIDVLIPFVLYTILNVGDEKGSSKKKNVNKKNAQTYLVENIKTLVDRGQNLVGIVDSMNKYVEVKKQQVQELGKDNVSTDKVEVLEVIRPYVQGKGREKIDKAIYANEKINSLKVRANKDMLTDFQDMTEILALIQSDTGGQVKEALIKLKNIMEILKS